MKEPIEKSPALSNSNDVKRRVLPLSALFAGLLAVFGLTSLPLPAAAAEPDRGIAILASDIGQTYPVVVLEEFVTQAHLRQFEKLHI